MKLRIKKLAMDFPGEKAAILLTAECAKCRALIGTVVLKDFVRGGCAEFSRLFVDGKFRRFGVARAMISAVAKLAKSGKASGLCAYVNQHNTEAFAFYERLGFLPVYRFHDDDHLIWRPL